MALVAAARAAAPAVRAATPLWPLPERARSSATTSSAGKSSKKARPAPASPRRAEVKSQSTASLEAEVFDDKEDPLSTPGVRRRIVMEDEQAAAPPSLPSVAPRLISVAMGASLVGRSFSFDAPLQRESAFPRPGLVASIETYPLLRTRTWVSTLGLGASFERDIGSASVTQADGGSLSYPVSQQRWAVDVRYALALGTRVVLVPLAGYGRQAYDVRRRVEATAPSACAGTSTAVCLPDASLSHLTLGGSVRVALTDDIGLSVDGAFLPALDVGSRLGSEAPASARGYAVELGAAWMLLDWLSLRAALPLQHHGYSWSSPAVMYRSASETYYGLVVGAAVFTR
jgi:hypothetical protein